MLSRSIAATGLQKQNIMLRRRLNLPATGGGQYGKGFHIPGDSERHGGSLFPLLRERLFECGFGNIHSTDIRGKTLAAQPEPFRLAEHMVHPLLTAGSFQPPDEPEELRLLQDIAGGGVPDVLQLFSQPGANPERPALLQHPADIGGHIAGKAALALSTGEPAGQKQVLLLLRLNAPILTSGMKSYQGTPGLVCRFLIFSVS